MLMKFGVVRAYDKKNNGFKQSFLQNEQKAPILALEKSKIIPKITHNPIWRPNGASDGKK